MSLVPLVFIAAGMGSPLPGDPVILQGPGGKVPSSSDSFSGPLLGGTGLIPEGRAGSLALVAS